MEIQETQNVRKNHIVEYINKDYQVVKARIVSAQLITQNKRDAIQGVKNSKYYTVQEEGSGRQYILNLGTNGTMGSLFVAFKPSDEGKVPGVVNVFGPNLTEAEMEEGYMREVPIQPPSAHEVNDPESEEENADTGKINLSKVMQEEGLEEHIDMKEVRALQNTANTLRDKIMIIQAEKLSGHKTNEKTREYIKDKEITKQKFESLKNKVIQRIGLDLDEDKASNLISKVNQAWEKLLEATSIAEEVLGVAKLMRASESILEASSIILPSNTQGNQALEEHSKDDEGNPRESTKIDDQSGKEAEEDTLGNIDSQVEKQKAEIQELEKRIKFYRISQEESTRKFNDLIKQHNKDMEDMRAAQDSGSDPEKTAALEKEKEQNKQLQYENADLREENNIFEQQNQNLNTKINRLQSENNFLKESITKLEDQGAQLSTRSNDLQIRNNKLESQIIPLQQNIKQLEKEMDQATVDFLKSISELSNQNSLLRTQVEEAGNKQEEAVKNLKKELTTTKTALSRAEAELAKNTMAPKPNSLGPPTTGTTQPVAPNTVDPSATETPKTKAPTFTTQAGRELEGRFHRLMIESETIAEKINQDVIKTKEDMEQMRSDVIKDAISIKGRTSRTKAMDKIIEFKQALRYFQSDADCGLIPATKEHKERIQKEIEKQDLLMSAVSQTNLDFIKESEQRNIRLIEMNHVDSKMLASSTPKFTGEGSLHVFQFLRNMDIHLKQRGVLHEDSGLVLREFCSGKAKNILDGTLRNNTNPEPEEIKRILVSHFGNKERILLEVQKEHESLGQIPHPCLLGSASNCFSLSEQHLSLIDKVEVLTKKTPYDLDQTIPIDLGELKLKAYVDSILPLLPMEFFREFRRDMRNTTVNNTTLLEKLKTTINEIKITAFENIQSQDMEREKRQKRQPVAKTFTAQNKEQCFICNHMEREHEIKPPNKPHSLYQNKNNIFCTKPESCGHISGLSILEKRDFCNSYGICPICLTRKEDENHNRDNCQFVKNVGSFKCRNSHCDERFSLCPDHVYLNVDALERTRRSLQQDNCQFNW